MCFIFLRCHHVKILIDLTLVLSMSVGVLCHEGDLTHSLFFMENLNWESTRIIQSKFDSEGCICGEGLCSVLTDSLRTSSCINISTIYQVNSSKDVFGKNKKYCFNAYRDDFLGREYVVPVLHYIKNPNTRNVLGFGNPANKTVFISIEYPSKQNFSFSLCENNTDNLELKGYEVKDFKFDCHIAGTHINASDNIIVYSAEVSDETTMAEQLIPVNLWGNYYVVIPSGKNLTQDIITILTAYDKTTVHILGYDYVIIPYKYESIQRRITSTSAVTIRSSLPVSVTQYIKDETEWTMITIIPMKYKLNTFSITNWNTKNKYAFATTSKLPNQTQKDEIPLFSKHYIRYLEEHDDSLTNYSIYGCRFLRDKGTIRFGSNCGLVNLSQEACEPINDNLKVDPDWPIMEPGNRRDNDENGGTDEEDCFADFASLTQNTNTDCRNPFLSDTSDTFGSLFVLPMTGLHENSSIRCLIESMSGRFPALTIHKRTQAETNGWERHTLNTTGYQNKMNQTIIQAQQAEILLVIETNRYENISLICHIECSDMICSNKFIVPPVDILQSQYIIPLLIQDEQSISEVQCQVVTIFNDTSYSVPYFNIHENNLPRLHNKSFTFSQYHQKSVFIVASHIISVVCVEKHEQFNIVQYVLPSTGMKYLLVKDNDPTNGVIAITLDDNTLLNISDTDTDFSNRYIVLEKAGRDSYVILKNRSSDLSISANKPIILLGFINCSCSPTRRNLVYVPAQDYVFNSENQTVSASTQCMPKHFRLFQRKPQTLSQQVPGDGLDNDQDGLVDEEYCGFLWNDSSNVDLDLDGSVNEDCKGCREGEMLNPKFRCEPCCFGTFRENSSRIDYCIDCENNFTTFSLRSSSPQDCVPTCGEGKELNNGTRMCEPCSIGSYKNVSANETGRSVNDRFWCKRCPGNSTTFTTGSAEYSDCIAICEKGMEWNNGTRMCEPCSIGSYKNVAANEAGRSVNDRFWCKRCPGNSTTFTTGSADCTAICEKGMEWNNGTKMCEPCSIGSYKNVSANETGRSVIDRFWCKRCPGNLTTFTTGSAEYSDCIGHCGLGQYLSTGNICLPCIVGTYKNTSSEDTSLDGHLRWNCSSCKKGQTTVANGSLTCVEKCREGLGFKNTTNKCEQCDIGFYRDTKSSHIMCQPCPANFTTRSRGAKSRDDCKPVDCMCPCDRIHVQKNFTSGELAKVIEEMKKELAVDKQHLSATLRTKISVKDNRPTATSVGSFGVVAITFVFVLLIAADIVILRAHLSVFFHRLVHFFKRG